MIRLLHRVRRGPRFVAGLFFMVFASAGALFGVGGANAAEVEGPAKVARQAYFTHPLTEATPPVLTAGGFPPSTACLVAGLVGFPQLCGTEIRDIADTLGLSDGLPIPSTPDADLVQLVSPGTTPVGMLGGQERYVSLIALELPALESGEEFTSFDLTLHQDGVNFAVESPAFRQLVLDAVLQIEEQDPEVFITLLEQIAAGEIDAIAQSVTGIEACPVTQPWNAGDAQNAALDGSRLPDSNCLLGTTGVFDPASDTWTFDLTFAAQAWTTGLSDGTVLPNEGIILRPVGAPNVAYGDPDLSTNFQISLADGDAAPALAPRMHYTTGASAGSIPTTLPTTPPASFTPLPSPASPGVSVVEVPVGSGLGTITARFAERDSASGHGSVPAWVWFLLPIGFAGAFLFGESLLAVPARVQRSGAMTRLMRVRGVHEETT